MAEAGDAAPRAGADVPLSRIVRIRELGDVPETHEVAATAAECAAVATQLGLPGVGALQGRFLLEPGRRGRVLASLHLRAEVTQVCVVSLDEFKTRIEEEARLVFIPAEDMADLDDDPESPDEIPFDGAMIDLGTALTEQLALALDPYPRKPDVTLPEEAQAARENPFAAFFGNADGKKPGS